MGPVDTLQQANVHRVRIEAYGRSVGDLNEVLHAAADRMIGVNGDNFLVVGQEVYERDVNEPDDSLAAFKARLVIHPAIQLAKEQT